MPKINLSTVQQAADTKYDDFVVELPTGQVVTFRAILRLDKAKRRELRAAMDLPARATANPDSQDDIYDVYRDAFRITAKTPNDFPILEQAIGDDPAVWTELFTAFTEDAQVGEASVSGS
jgi:Mycobacteriophage tail assembly protein